MRHFQVKLTFMFRNVVSWGVHGGFSQAFQNTGMVIGCTTWPHGSCESEPFKNPIELLTIQMGSLLLAPLRVRSPFLQVERLACEQNRMIHRDYSQPSAVSYMRFPKLGVPPNLPFIEGFSIINHPFWGSPISGNPQKMVMKLLPRRLAVIGTKLGGGPSILSAGKTEVNSLWRSWDASMTGWWYTYPKMWLRQLGLWNSQLNGKSWNMFQTMIFFRTHSNRNIMESGWDVLPRWCSSFSTVNLPVFHGETHRGTSLSVSRSTSSWPESKGPVRQASRRVTTM